jgi:hypothetical protein
MSTTATWKDFVVTLCRLGSTNSSREISDAIQRTSGQTVSSGSIAAVKANYKMGRYTA